MRDREKREERLRVGFRRSSRINTSRFLSAFPHSIDLFPFFIFTFFVLLWISLRCVLYLLYTHLISFFHHNPILTHPPSPLHHLSPPLTTSHLLAPPSYLHPFSSPITPSQAPLPLPLSHNHPPHQDTFNTSNTPTNLPAMSKAQI